MIEPLSEPGRDSVHPKTPPKGTGFVSRMFGSRRSEEPKPERPDDVSASEPGQEAGGRPTSDVVKPRDVVNPNVVEPPAYGARAAAAGDDGETSQLGERMQSGFQDMSRLLGAIKETLQGRDGHVQQSLQALPDFLQQVPRIHRAEIECLAQISKQLEHMGTGTRDVLARFEGLPDLLRSLMVGQQEQSKFLDNLQANVAETLEIQGQALREGLETSRKSSENQLKMIRAIASTQEDIFSTFQNTQNRALNVFHRAQQQTIAQNKNTTKVMNRQIEMLVEKVHAAQGRVFWLSIGFAALAAAGLLAVLFLN